MSVSNAHFWSFPGFPECGLPGRLEDRKFGARSLGWFGGRTNLRASSRVCLKRQGYPDTGSDRRLAAPNFQRRPPRNAGPVGRADRVTVMRASRPWAQFFSPPRQSGRSLEAQREILHARAVLGEVEQAEQRARPEIDAFGCRVDLEVDWDKRQTRR